jgi:biopolymer transport protein ExbD
MRYFEERKGRVEIIPMIDIMLFLLVFFVMIALRMIPATGINSRLPSSTTAATMNHPQVVISLNSDGAIKVDGQTVTQGALLSLLSRKQPEQRRVTIAAAKGASVQQLMRVMDVCRQAGIQRIGIAARKSRSD